jgi:hypothetical protein
MPVELVLVNPADPTYTPRPTSEEVDNVMSQDPWDILAIEVVALREVERDLATQINELKAQVTTLECLQNSR